jgi:hypothetical protein
MLRDARCLLCAAAHQMSMLRAAYCVLRVACCVLHAPTLGLPPPLRVIRPSPPVVSVHGVDVHTRK